MKQDPPFSLHVEPTEGCTLACYFCAMQAIRDNGADAATQTHGPRSGPYKFMSLDLAQRLANEVQRLGWNPRIEIDMRGEPTINPLLDKIIYTFRDALPKHYIVLTTNGSGVMKPYQMQALFDAGVSTIALDDYKHAKFVDRIRIWAGAWCQQHGVDLYEYPVEDLGNPHHRMAGKRLTIIHDIADNTHGTHKLTNQAGNSFEASDERSDKRCAKPFRDLPVHWNGNVPLCCDDWTGTYKIGNVMDMPLDELWNHPRWQAARQALYHGRRDMMQPCSGCNVVTFRNGLLPDKYGKRTLPAPTHATRKIIAQAQAGKPFTPRVKK